MINDLAARQHGIVARWQLVDSGLPTHIVEYRVRIGRLAPVHRGVYRATPLVGPLAREMAAVLACGSRSVVSHRSAAGLWEILPSNPRRPVDIIVRGRRPSRIPGLQSRLGPGLASDEVTSKNDVPLTTVSRTLIDLAGVATFRDLERALARADQAGMLDRTALMSLMARCPRRLGAPVLRALLFSGASPSMTRSDAEYELLSLLRQAALPLPETNVKVEGFEVDLLWRAGRLIVEVDGFTFHSSRTAFERDRRRDATLNAAGYRVVRVTWQQIKRKPIPTVAMLAQVLGR